jgi:putative transposase
MGTIPIRKRCQRRNIPGHAHYLTFSCFKRQPFLTRPRARQWLIESIERALIRHDVHLWAWVFMPEHVHLVIHPQRPRYSIAVILQSIKQPVSQRIVAHVRRTAPDFPGRMSDAHPAGRSAYRFWQRGGGHDRNLYSAQEIHEKIGYTHRNPVRLELVQRPEDREFSSAREYMQLRAPPLLKLDRSGVPPL